MNKRERRCEKRANMQDLPDTHSWKQPKHCWYSEQQRQRRNSVQVNPARSYYTLDDGRVVETTDANTDPNFRPDFDDAQYLGLGHFARIEKNKV